MSLRSVLHFIFDILPQHWVTPGSKIEMNLLKNRQLKDKLTKSSNNSEYLLLTKRVERQNDFVA